MINSDLKLNEDIIKEHSNLFEEKTLGEATDLGLSLDIARGLMNKPKLERLLHRDISLGDALYGLADYWPTDPIDRSSIDFAELMMSDIGSTYGVDLTDITNISSLPFMKRIITNKAYAKNLKRNLIPSDDLSRSMVSYASYPASDSQYFNESELDSLRKDLEVNLYEYSKFLNQAIYDDPKIGHSLLDYFILGSKESDLDISVRGGEENRENLFRLLNTFDMIPTGEE